MVSASDFISVKDYGAVGDGSHDDTSAINNASSQSPAGATIFFPPGQYYVTQTINIQPGKTFQGLTTGSSVTGANAAIVGALGLSTVLFLSGGAGSFSGGVRQLGITRVSGSFSPSSIGLLVYNANNVVIEDVWSNRHGVCFQISNGVDTTINRLNTYATNNYHVVIAGLSAGSYFTNCLFGRNGAVDMTCNAYIAYEGSQWDTSIFNGCLFNQGQNTVTNALYVTGYNDANGILHIFNCHAETFSGAFLSIDNSTTILQRLKIIGCSITSNGSSLPLISSVGAKLQDVVLQGNDLETSLALDQVNGVTVTGNLVGGNVIVNAGSNVITGNLFRANVTLEGAVTKLVYVGNAQAGLSDTSTGPKQVALNA